MTIPVFLVLSICKDFNLRQTGSVPAGPPTGAGGDHLNNKGGGSPHHGEAKVRPLEDGTTGVYVTWGYNEGNRTIVTSYLGLKNSQKFKLPLILDLSPFIYSRLVIKMQGIA